MTVFAIRHGETAWSLSGQHTGTTDIPLTDDGRQLVEQVRPVLAREAFALVLCRPLQRARETCDLARLGDTAVIESDLVEWDYGTHEGLAPRQIRDTAPGWLVFRDGCSGDGALHARRTSVREQKATASRLPLHLVPNVERRMEDQGLTSRTSRRPIATGVAVSVDCRPETRL